MFIFILYTCERGCGYFWRGQDPARFKAKAIMALQEATEVYATALFEDMNVTISIDVSLLVIFRLSDLKSFDKQSTFPILNYQLNHLLEHTGHVESPVYRKNLGQ